ncbi:hypothetical protein HID58_035353 [Brassica napus]|uniref:Uncharacterized protein n=1 Tax=Brassica napus TaxID=3708 RepID=A0ABQ8C4N3_BRANA|nr:hypothetical protein HID58_035353 [Brassica napus]
MCGRRGQIKSWCSCEPKRKTNKGRSWFGSFCYTKWHES